MAADLRGVSIATGSGCLARADRLPRRGRRSAGSTRIAGASGRERTIDIGYRTVPGKPYLGRHAMLKAELADAVRERAQARGLRVDISTRAEDTLYGDDWYRFLASAGTRSASRAAPACSTATARCARCIERAPRRAARRDVRGARGRLLPRPRRRALAVRDVAAPSRGLRDAHGADPRRGRLQRRARARASTTSSCAATSRTSTRCSTRGRGPPSAERVAAAAYADVVASGRWTYRRLVEDVERELPGRGPAPGGRPRRGLARASTASPSRSSRSPPGS